MPDLEENLQNFKACMRDFRLHGGFTPQEAFNICRKWRKQPWVNHAPHFIVFLGPTNVAPAGISPSNKMA